MANKVYGSALRKGPEMLGAIRLDWIGSDGGFKAVFIQGKFGASQNELCGFLHVLQTGGLSNSGGLRKVLDRSLRRALISDLVFDMLCPIGGTRHHSLPSYGTSIIRYARPPRR
jgi:hypothetical protein